MPNSTTNITDKATTNMIFSNKFLPKSFLTNRLLTNKVITNRALTIGVGLAMAFSLSAESITKSLSIHNPSDFSRTDAPVALSLEELNLPFSPTSALVRANGKEVSSQLDDLDRNSVYDEVAFTLDLASNQSVKVEIEFSDTKQQKQYTPRTFAQMLVRGYQDAIVPIGDISVDGDVDSYTLLYGHGVMFESELNGYRIYFDPKQTLDPYGKYNKGLELQESQFYPTDEQLARGFGDDVLMVGSSCGIGALKGWNGNEAVHVSPVSRRSQRVISSGPVRAIVEVVDQDWDYQGFKHNMTQRFTQWAGHRDVNIDVNFDKPLKDETFAIGVQNIMGNETVHTYGDKDSKGTVASWGRHWPVGDTIKFGKVTLGMATYVPEDIAKKRIEDENGYYFLVRAPGRKHFNYNTQFTCDKETFGYPNAQSWFDSLTLWKKELDTPLEIVIEQ